MLLAFGLLAANSCFFRPLSFFKSDFFLVTFQNSVFRLQRGPNNSHLASHTEPASLEETGEVVSQEGNVHHMG